MSTQLPTSTPPALRTKHQIVDYLLSFDLFKGIEHEGYAYVNDAIGRFLTTIKMVPPAVGPDATLLELGANPYFISLLLKKFHHYQWHGANYFGSAETKSVAEQTIRSERYGETHTFQYAHFNVEFDDFPFADASFDGVLFCEILEHLTVNPTHTLNEIHRVLKPGGYIILTTPNMVRWEHLWQLMLGHNIHDPYSGYGVYGRHNREYAPQEVIQLLRECGFSVQQLRIENTHAVSRTQHMLTAIRKHWREHIFALARAEAPPRYQYSPWLYRSMASMRRITSAEVVIGYNDELHTGLGWHTIDELPEAVRWTQQAAEISLRARGGEDTVRVEAFGDASALGPVEVTLRSGSLQQRYRLDDGDWHALDLAILPCEAGSEVHIWIEVDHLRCPARLTASLDARQLGVMVRKVLLKVSSSGHDSLTIAGDGPDR